MIPKFAKVTNFSPLHKKNNIRADSGGGLIHQEEGAGKARKRQMRQEEADDGDGGDGTAVGRYFACPPGAVSRGFRAHRHFENAIGHTFLFSVMLFKPINDKRKPVPSPRNRPVYKTNLTNRHEKIFFICPIQR